MQDHHSKQGTEPDFGNTGQRVRKALSEAGRHTRERLGEQGRQAVAYCQAMEDSNYDYVTRHPAASLAVMAVAGAAVGYLLGSRGKAG